MTPEDLLTVSPDFLAKTILHRREVMMQDLPDNLANRQEEKQIAAKLAQESRVRKDEISSKFNNLLRESKSALEDSIDLISQMNEICHRESGEYFIDRSELNLSIEEHNLPENFKKVEDILAKKDFSTVKNLQSDKVHQELSKFRERALDLIQAGKKANIAKSELSTENDNLNSIWLENESHRRRCESRYTKLKRSNEETKAAVEFWSSKINSDFEDLLLDAKRVADGGPSSRYLMKQNNPIKNRRRK